MKNYVKTYITKHQLVKQRQKLYEPCERKKWENEINVIIEGYVLATKMWKTLPGLHKNTLLVLRKLKEREEVK